MYGTARSIGANDEWQRDLRQTTVAVAADAIAVVVAVVAIFAVH